MAMNFCPARVNSTTWTEPTGPLGVSAGTGVTQSTRESGKSEA